MKSAGFHYHDPHRLDEVLGLLASLDNARLLAGGQSLMPMLNLRLVYPDHLIDLNRVEGLAGIAATETGLRIGAMTRQRALEDSPDILRRCPLMAEALTQIGHRQTRNRGTIGGSLCHLDPSAELVSVAAALDAEILVAGPAGQRRIAMTDFPAGFMTPSLAPEEIVTAIDLPDWPAGHGHSFGEFARRHGDYAIVSAAVLLLRGADGRLSRASITLGGVGHAPLRLLAAEALLQGAAPSEALFRDAAATCRDIDAISDPAVPGWYRQRVAEVLVRRGLGIAFGRAA
ncbi:FAD binding domain-containing protein [Humitalea sp. 24SJ18S-53]|uniref:FAD binding domain-containing protein n=1 Tax=Humitalea sp. 24SJ18S-53 TaxID=3422307 RepID=UPI003D67DC1E